MLNSVVFIYFLIHFNYIQCNSTESYQNDQDRIPNNRKQNNMLLTWFNQFNHDYN